MPRITAYHVSTEQDLNRVETNVCDDEYRDGYLYGAEVACFTTTLYKGRLPDFSPYPRSYEAGEDFGYRYTTTFDPDHFDKFLMATTTQDEVTQVHFLLLDTRRPRERVVASFVRAFLAATDENFDEEGAWDTYFPDGEANDYARGDKVFVNVAFWHRVSVKKARIDGSHAIEKRGPTIRRTPFTGETNWFKRLLDQLSNKREADDDDDDVDELTRGVRSTRIGSQ